MKYILKSHKISEDVNEYIVFDTENRTKSRFPESSQRAKQMGIPFISKYKATFLNYFNFKNVR